jgi:hypothetical protein
MEEQALTFLLKLAGHIGHPVAVAVFAVVIAASVFAVALRAKRPVIGSILAAGIIVLGVAPFVASGFLQTRGVYHVQVVLLRPDQSPVDIAQVKSSNGGELRWSRVGGNSTFPSRPGRPTAN